MDGLQAGDPQRIGPYRLLGRLGAGGMGRVFLGRSAGGRLVAVKVIRPELAGEPGFRARFEREVSAARNVSGLFTAVVVDADVFGAVPWLATAYVPGPSLDDAVSAEGPLPVSSVLALAAGLAEGLQAIHATGLVHRDIKPSNVLLASDGPRVIDFGISRAAEASALTQTGMAIGSPGFMSPEQAEGGAVGPTSDVFSLGAVLVFAATGEGPFGAGSTPALMFRVVHRQPDTSRVPEQIRPLVERCLARDPHQRPTTAGLLAELGGGRLAADWLPGPLTQVVGRYGVVSADEVAGLAAPAGLPGPSGGPVTPVRLNTVAPQGPVAPRSPVAPETLMPHERTAVASPSAADIPGAPVTRTVAQPRRTPRRTAVQPHPGIADDLPPRRNRRGRAALVAAGLIVAAATAVVVPKALAHSAASPLPRTTQARSALNSSARTSQTGGSMHSSSAPTPVPSSPGSVMGSPDPTSTATAPSSGMPTPSPTPTSTTTTPAPTSTPTASPTPAPSMEATAPPTQAPAKGTTAPAPTAST